MEKFTVSVNVAAGSKVTFELTYEELLKRHKGKYEMYIKVKPKQLVKHFEVVLLLSSPFPVGLGERIQGWGKHPWNRAPSRGPECKNSGLAQRDDHGSGYSVWKPKGGQARPGRSRLGLGPGGGYSTPKCTARPKAWVLGVL